MVLALIAAFLAYQVYSTVTYDWRSFLPDSILGHSDCDVNSTNCITFNNKCGSEVRVWGQCQANCSTDYPKGVRTWGTLPPGQSWSARLPAGFHGSTQGMRRIETVGDHHDDRDDHDDHHDAHGTDYPTAYPTAFPTAYPVRPDYPHAVEEQPSSTLSLRYGYGTVHGIDAFSYRISLVPPDAVDVSVKPSHEDHAKLANAVGFNCHEVHCVEDDCAHPTAQAYTCPISSGPLGEMPLTVTYCPVEWADVTWVVVPWAAFGVVLVAVVAAACCCCRRKRGCCRGGRGPQAPRAQYSPVPPSPSAPPLVE